MLPKTTMKLLKLLPTGEIVKVKLELVQVPEVGLQLVLASAVNSAGATITRDVELAEKEDAIVKGELMVRVKFEF